VKTTPIYGNESITALKGADRVRKRPSVIFGSDGLEGCQHAVFEVISNSIDEAREGYGRRIEVTRHRNQVITVKDFARGIPVDYNPIEKAYNWELLFCELYAGGKYDNNDEDFYEFSLGLNGLGMCATQYSAEYMDVVYRHFRAHRIFFGNPETPGHRQRGAALGVCRRKNRGEA
jgi:DNA gyrase subunit B